MIEIKKNARLIDKKVNLRIFLEFYYTFVKYYYTIKE